MSELDNYDDGTIITSYKLYDAAKDIPKEIPKDCIWSRKEIEPVENVLHTVKLIYERWQSDFEPVAIRTFLSGKTNFRDNVAVSKEYKGGRVAAKPVHYPAIRDYLVERAGAEVAVGQEADDLLGIGLTELGPKAVAVSIDKDLLQVPGLHYNWVNDELIEVSKKDGFLNFVSQLLTGDPTDNVPGLRGVGPVAARKILEGAQSPAEAFFRVYVEYRKQVPDPEGCRRYLTEQANLLWIRRERDAAWSPAVSFDDLELKYAELQK